MLFSRKTLISDSPKHAFSETLFLNTSAKKNIHQPAKIK